MAVRNLFRAFQLAGQAPHALRDTALTTESAPTASTTPGAFVDVGTVQAVTDTSVTVSFRGATETAQQSSDEPLRAGQSVFVSRDASGKLVVHGSVR
jgi:hypothetical protein